MFAIAQTAWLACGLTSIGWLLGLRHLGHTTQHSTLGRCQQLHGRRSLESILDSVSGFLAWWAKGPSQPVSRGPGVFPPMVELQGGLWAHRRIPGSHHGRAGVCEDHLFCGLQIIHLIQQRCPDSSMRLLHKLFPGMVNIMNIHLEGDQYCRVIRDMDAYTKYIHCRMRWLWPSLLNITRRPANTPASTTAREGSKKRSLDSMTYCAVWASRGAQNTITWTGSPLIWRQAWW